jgi:hypothetical protein
MNRTERRAAAIKAVADAAVKAAFVAKMKTAKEAKLAQKLFLERKVKLVSLPTPEALAAVERYMRDKAKRLAEKRA